MNLPTRKLYRWKDHPWSKSSDIRVVSFGSPSLQEVSPSISRSEGKKEGSGKVTKRTPDRRLDNFKGN